MSLLRICVFVLTLCPILLPAQIAFWQHYIGGSGFDMGKRIIYRPDGTLIIAAEVMSKDGLGKDNHGESADIVIAKYTSQGRYFWINTLGGSGHEQFGDLIETRDGGFAMIGTSSSSDGTVESNHGRSDLWVVKIDRLGRTEWSKTFGGRGDDKGASIIETKDHGYLIGGESSSNNGDMRSPHHGGLDSWVAKLSSQGRLLWEKHYGGSGNEKVCGLHQLNDTTYVIINSSDSRNLDVAANLGRKDAWVFTIDDLGQIQWQANFGGDGNDDVHSSLIDKEGFLLIAGTTFSSSGFVSRQQGEGDFWISKISPGVGLKWSRTFGGERADGANSIRLAEDGSYLIAGMTKSRGGDIISNSGYYDGWFGKVDINGTLLWSRSIGYSEKDVLYDVMELKEGGYLALGYSEHAPRDFSQPGHKGSSDIWLCNFSDPKKGLKVRPYRTPPVLIGTIKNKETGLPLEASITLTENISLDSLGNTNSNGKDGSFVLLLPSYGLVSINVLAKDYLFYGEDIFMDTVIDRTMLETTILLEPIRIGSSLILKHINFNTGKWDLLSSSYAELERVVAFLKLNPRVVIQISGHTDNTGNKSQKVELSLRRATSVQKYLIKKGIDKMRTRVKGYGMYRPIAKNSTPAGRRKNRRVEFEVLNK